MPLGKNTFMKSAQYMGQMFKQMLGSTLQAWALQQIMKLINPLIKILDPIAVLFSIIGGLLMMMIGEALQPFYEGMMPIYDVMLSLAPVFQLIGRLLGIVIQIGLIPLTVAFKLLDKVLTPIMPTLDPLLDGLDEISPLIEIFTDVLVNGLMGGIKWVINGIIGIINGVIKWSNKTFGTDYDTIPRMQRGGRMQEDGLAYLHRGETVNSSASTAENDATLRRIADGIDYLVKQKRERW